VRRKYPAKIEVWVHLGTGPMLLGTASTIRGVRQIVRRRCPVALRVILRGTADALDQANGLSMTWSKRIDLVTRDVPVDYEIVKEEENVTLAILAKERMS
jgi:hypothetical protein